ncbi:hypothetical protein FHS14_005866 [Paenibacillus baekrokdamisoli]|nr:hypothetical protein [Paenibacillus baekrokdamisoli]
MEIDNFGMHMQIEPKKTQNLIKKDDFQFKNRIDGRPFFESF